MSKENSPVYLVADIGGTNTRIGLCNGSIVQPDSVERYANAAFGSFADVLRIYLNTHDATINAVCVAMAGPVEGSHGHMTNLDWQLDTEMLCQVTGAERAEILNDLQAQGYSLGHLGEGSYEQLLTGQSSSVGASQMVVGVGTGFNIAPVHYQGHNRMVVPSESGHMGLTAQSRDERELVDKVTQELGFASIEDALSGTGIAQTDRRLRGADTICHDGAPGVIKAAHSGDRDAVRAVTVTCRLLGAVAGDLALSHLPFGGVFLIGGVARALQPFLSTHGFSDAFCDKGRFSAYMQRFPVFLINDDFAALTGCASYIHAFARSR